MDEYVDVFDAKYTKWLKRIAAAKLIIRTSWIVLLGMCFIVLWYEFEPYVYGWEEFDPLPITLSQLEAILCFFTIAWMVVKSMKVLR